ncbi:hypothetical protein M2271_005687 [Streptomyces sp. LBL]|nr:hypothetical protein [Streptomyces sp. LBL]
MLLAPETAAQAHTSRIAVSEYHRPRRARVGHRGEVGAQVGDPAGVQRPQFQQHGR